MVAGLQATRCWQNFNLLTLTLITSGAHEPVMLCAAGLLGMDIEHTNLQSVETLCSEGRDLVTRKDIRALEERY